MRTGNQTIDRALDSFLRRDRNALAEIKNLLDKGTVHPHLVLAEAELLVDRGEEEPLGRLSHFVGSNPNWVEGHDSLASLRFALGDNVDFASSFRDALSSSPKNAALWNGYIAALVGAGKVAEAANVARDAREHFDAPVLRLIEANHASAAGELDRAEALLDELDKTLPDFASTLARHRIRTGDLAEAQAMLERCVDGEPENLSLWAQLELVWRANADSRADWLSTGPGFCSQTSFDYSPGEISELAEFVRRLHTGAGAPMGHSARGGSQTRGSLFRREDRQIVELQQRLQMAVDAYMAQLPAEDAKHPLLRHKRARIVVAGGWSIRLSGAGFHVAHLHPGGIVSSAFYLAVPDLEEGATDGYLELGRPPQNFQLELEPICTVRPEPGKLVLFPSYLYHGTRPFREGERLSVAFDASLARR